METQHQQSLRDQDEQVIGVDFRRYLSAVRKYKWIIASIVALAITGAVLYTSQQTEIFQATASMVIDPKLPDLLGQGQEMVVSGGSGSSTAEYYRQQREVLQSYQLMRRTVENNDLQVKLLSADEREGLTQEEVLDLTTRRLRDALSITYPEQNRIMYVTVKNPDAQAAADVANAHVDTYVSWTRGQLSLGTQRASKWLATELELAEKKLRESDTKLVEFQKANDILSVSLEDRQNMVTANITRYTEALNDARAKRIELSSILDRMKKTVGSDVVKSPIFGLTETAALDSIKSQYYLERNKFLEIEKEVGPKNIEYVKQKVKVEDLHSALENEAQLAVMTIQEKLAAARTTETAFDQEIERYRQEAFQLGPKLVQFNQLLRDRKSNEDKYNILVNRLGTSDLNSRLDSVNVTPLDRARAPTEPVFPSLRRNVVLGGAIALFLGVGVAFLLTFLDRSVKTLEDIQATAQLPVLGIIPMLSESDVASNDDKARDLYVFQHPTSRVAECCRALRTNILFSGADRPLKTLVVSSPNPREGKTTSVIYLGTTMAQSGQRVLLIDSDMRRPRLHQSMSVPRQMGLSNLIVGEVDFNDVIKTTEIPNLYVMPCGPLPPNPAELLMTNRFQSVLEELGRRFDRILLDSPPLQAVTDAVVLSRHSDGVILVVKAGKTLREDITRSVRQLASVDGTVVGVILNEIDLDQRRDYYYYSYYGYGKDQVQEPEAAA
ncbi:MAG TPA: polysaccharide biosynthesis tyrosine autokinase [Kofleriaceae bacterium]|nr:polysaccharide biosynthesis tyrosine autokinase [Kofleriaceae bacterium]